MNRIYHPTSGADDWRWRLANPALHWKQDRSAKSLADAWERGAGVGKWPRQVAAVLSTDAELSNAELLLGLPEHTTPLPGGSTASQTDLLVLARTRSGGLTVMAVEGKVDESFGELLTEWLVHTSTGKKERLQAILETLGLPDDERLATVRYQLLHRAAAAVIEAKRFNAERAVLMIHSFSVPGADAWFDDFAAFVGLFGAVGEMNRTINLGAPGGIELSAAWVSDKPAPAEPAAVLGSRLDRAFSVASQLHGDQVRKGTSIPYLSHLMTVCALVIEDGGDEDEAIAALLHDAVEDQGGKKTLGRIRRMFGRHVAAIVEACSDTDKTPKPPWRERKELYIAHLKAPDLEPGVIRVSLADKLHNARAILADLRADEDVFSRFNAPREEQAWYYRALAEVFTERTDSRMATELARTVEEIFARR